jgi:hypothetical protein
MEEPISTVVVYDDFSHDAGIRKHSSAASQVGNETPQLSCVTRAEDIKPNRKNSVRATVDTDDSFFNLLHGSDPIRMELTRLENVVKGTCTFHWRAANVVFKCLINHVMFS